MLLFQIVRPSLSGYREKRKTCHDATGGRPLSRSLIISTLVASYDCIGNMYTTPSTAVLKKEEEYRGSSSSSRLHLGMAFLFDRSP